MGLIFRPRAPRFTGNYVISAEWVNIIKSNNSFIRAECTFIGLRCVRQVSSERGVFQARFTLVPSSVNVRRTTRRLLRRKRRCSSHGLHRDVRERRIHCEPCLSQIEFRLFSARLCSV